MKVPARSLAQLALPYANEQSYIATICDWERIEYGENKHRTIDSFYQCVKKNRTGFYLQLNHGKLIGYADIWELQPDFYSMLKSGTIDEESIAAKYVLGRTEPRTGLWYIGSIITDPKMRLEHPIGAAFVFRSICNALPQFFQEHSVFPAKILGVGSSAFGKKLLARWGFKRVDSDPNAIDFRPRFEKNMTKPSDADTLGFRSATIS